MPNPFTGKSLAELLEILPSLSDPELNALCAAVCDGEWVRYRCGRYFCSDPDLAFARYSNEFGNWIWMPGMPKFTSGGCKTAVTAELTRMIERTHNAKSKSKRQSMGISGEIRRR